MSNTYKTTEEILNIYMEETNAVLSNIDDIIDIMKIKNINRFNKINIAYYIINPSISNKAVLNKKEYSIFIFYKNHFNIEVDN
jgi:hypothetical protein